MIYKQIRNVLRENFIYTGSVFVCITDSQVISLGAFLSLQCTELGKTRSVVFGGRYTADTLSRSLDSLKKEVTCKGKEQELSQQVFKPPKRRIFLENFL